VAFSLQEDEEAAEEVEEPGVARLEPTRPTTFSLACVAALQLVNQACNKEAREADEHDKGGMVDVVRRLDNETVPGH
jgi:hypothetical protein